MTDRPEEPIDHPSLAKYPDSPIALSRVDGGPLYRVPIRRDRDEAVAVPVSDLMEARLAIHQFRRLIDAGAGDDAWLERLGWSLVDDPSDPARPRTREEVSRYLTGVWERVSSWLPYW